MAKEPVTVIAGLTLPADGELTLEECERITAWLKVNTGAMQRFSTLNKRTRLAVGSIIWLRRSKGETMAQICEDLGVSRQTGGRYERIAIDAITPVSSEEARERSLAQVEELLGVWMPRAMNAQVSDEKALAGVVRLLERRDKLAGADAPTRIEAQVHEVTQADLEFAEELRVANAKSAAREAAAVAAADA